MSKVNLNMNNQDHLKELVTMLDETFGEMTSNKEEFETLDDHLGKLMVSMDITMDNVEKFDLKELGVKFHEIYPTLKIAVSLLRYTVENYSENFESGYILQSDLFERIMSGSNLDE